MGEALRPGQENAYMILFAYEDTPYRPSFHLPVHFHDGDSS